MNARKCLEGKARRQQLNPFVVITSIEIPRDRNPKTK